MKHRLWIALKILLPILVLIYVEESVRLSLEAFWMRHLLSSYPFFIQGMPFLTSSASIVLTLLTLFAIGSVLELHVVKNAFDRLSSHVPLLRYFWSGGEEALAHAKLVQPVLFQHPVQGEWKLGFIMGNQRMDGREMLRIFYITIGDHAFIEKDRTDLYVPLANPPLEAARCITSFMASGPKEFFKDELRV